MSPQFGFLDLGTPQLVIVLVILLLLFGSKKLPELSRSLGQSVKELREGLTDSDDKNKREHHEQTKAADKPKQL